VLCSLFFISQQNVYALDQNKKLWTSFATQKPFTADKKWNYLFYSSLRFIDEDHPVQTFLLEGGVGYKYVPGQSVWLGYRWQGNNFNHGFYQENRLWQQMVWETKDLSLNRVLLRSRLEEFIRSNQSQTGFRLRERFFVEMPNLYNGCINPVFYDEVFFQLNKTDYTSHQFVSQNRLFVGFNYMLTAENFWEIGYLNEYLFATPQRSDNQMNHVISLTYIVI
jgi:hypothetical protein